ncbi:MAG: amidohydrolase family protein [Clostridiales bacterium]|nr:amidohydrolase family protein [Clostridiales bacterium]
MEESNSAYYRVDEIKELFEKFSRKLVGLKTRASKGFIDSEKPLFAAIEMAENIGCPLVVHANDPVISMEELAGMLRPGDILCHVYHGIGDTILNEHGKVKDGILKARERGVLFDVAHGRGNFNLHVAGTAIADGFIPDIISTDMTVFVRNQAPVYSLPYVMSKIRCLGVPWTEVFRAVTLTPAHWLGESQKASLVVGTEANLAIFKIKKRIIRYEDAFGNSFDGNEILLPQMTVVGGEILFRQTEFQ